MTADGVPPKGPGGSLQATWVLCDSGQLVRVCDKQEPASKFTAFMFCNMLCKIFNKSKINV